MTGYVGPIEKQTTEITYFRQVLFTGPHSQLVVMCLRPGEDTEARVSRHTIRGTAHGSSRIPEADG